MKLEGGRIEGGRERERTQRVEQQVHVEDNFMFYYSFFTLD